MLSLQNGLNEPVIAEEAGAARTIGAVVRFDGALMGPGHVTQQLSDGDLIIGAFDPSGAGRIAGIADLLRPALPVAVSADIRVELWSKLTRNCLLNAVSTLVGMGLGRMAAIPEVRTISLGTGLEVVAVARAVGVALEPSIMYDVDATCCSLVIRPQCGDFHVAFARAYARVPDLKPSMLQDAEKGRTVEVRWLNGAVAETGAGAGVHAPINRALTERVEELIRGERTPGIHNLVQCLSITGLPKIMGT